MWKAFITILRNARFNREALTVKDRFEQEC